MDAVRDNQELLRARSASKGELSSRCEVCAGQLLLFQWRSLFTSIFGLGAFKCEPMTFLEHPMRIQDLAISRLGAIISLNK